MPLLNVVCPQCGFAGKIPESIVGTTVRCKQCRAQFLTLPPDDDVPQPDFEQMPEPAAHPYREPESSFNCPFCKTHYSPIVSKKISGTAWGLVVALVFANFVLCVIFAVAFFPCAVVMILLFPACFIPLFTLKEECCHCSDCGIKLG